MKKQIFKVLVAVRPGSDDACGDCRAVDYDPVPSCAIPWNHDLDHDEPIPLEQCQEEDPDKADYGEVTLLRCRECLEAEAAWQKEQSTHESERFYLRFEVQNQGGAAYIARATDTLGQVVQEISGVLSSNTRTKANTWQIDGWHAHNRCTDEVKTGKLTTKDMTKPLNSLAFSEVAKEATVTIRLRQRKSGKPA